MSAVCLPPLDPDRVAILLTCALHADHEFSTAIAGVPSDIPTIITSQWGEKWGNNGANSRFSPTCGHELGISLRL